MTISHKISVLWWLAGVSKFRPVRRATSMGLSEISLELVSTSKCHRNLICTTAATKKPFSIVTCKTVH